MNPIALITLAAAAGDLSNAAENTDAGVRINYKPTWGGTMSYKPMTRPLRPLHSPPKNQRKERKNRRRRWAQGDKKAFTR